MSSAAMAAPRPAAAPPPIISKQPANLFVAETWGFVDAEMRVTSGHAQARCIKLIFAKTLSAPRKKGTAAPEVSCPLHTDDYAAFLAPDHIATDAHRRTAQSVLDEGLKRSVFFRRQATRAEFIAAGMKPPLSLRGWYVYWLPTEWSTVAPYAAPKKPVASAEELDAAAAAEEETAAPLPDRWREKIAVTPEPVKVIEGRPSKTIPLPVPAFKTRWRTNHPDLRIAQVLHMGVLTVDIVDPERANKKRNTEVHFGLKNGTGANTELSDATSARDAPLVAAVARDAPLVAEVVARPVENPWRNVLNDLFRSSLGPIDNHMLRQVVEAAGAATAADVAGRLRPRANKRAFKTWGGVLAAVREIGQAAAQAGPPGSNGNGVEPGFEPGMFKDPEAVERQLRWGREMAEKIARRGGKP